MIPSAKDWKYMRQTLQLFMPDTVSIYSVTTAKDRYGKETTTRTLVSTTKAQLSNASGSEKQIIAEQIATGVENLETAKLVLPYGTSIQASNQVETTDGKFWNVTFSNTSQTFTAATEALLYRRIINGDVDG